MQSSLGYSAPRVANTVLAICKERGISDLSPLKLQKLVYYAHAWHLAIHKRPLLADQVEAWTYGPVVAHIYHSLKAHKAANVTDPLIDLVHTGDGKVKVIRDNRIPESDTEANEVVSEVIDVYGKYTAIQLSNLSHASDEAWAEVLRATDGGPMPRGLVIPDDLIQRVFAAKLQENTTEQSNGEATNP
jgi:uncharacterized phage-associated protein